MPYCPNCSSQVAETHRYCGTCGRQLSEVAANDDEAPMASRRDGFLSRRTLRYLTDLREGRREIERDSASHSQLKQEVQNALAYFAMLASVERLNLLYLWTSETDADSLSVSIEEMNRQQQRDFLATLGISRVLSLYDSSLGTDFEAEFNSRLDDLMEFAEERHDGSE